MNKAARKDRPLLDTLTRTQAYAVSYFGFCPECRRPPTGEGRVAPPGSHGPIPRFHWCEPCRTIWCSGADRPPSYDEDWAAAWEGNYRGLREGGYREVESAGGEEIPLTLWERFLEWRQERWARRHVDDLPF